MQKHGFLLDLIDCLVSSLSTSPLVAVSMWSLSMMFRHSSPQGHGEIFLPNGLVEIAWHQPQGERPLFIGTFQQVDMVDPIKQCNLHQDTQTPGANNLDLAYKIRCWASAHILMSSHVSTMFQQCFNKIYEIKAVNKFQHFFNQHHLLYHRFFFQHKKHMEKTVAFWTRCGHPLFFQIAVAVEPKGRTLEKPQQVVRSTGPLILLVFLADKSLANHWRYRKQNMYIYIYTYDIYIWYTYDIYILWYIYM